MKIPSVNIIDIANDFSAVTSRWRPVVVRFDTDEESLALAKSAVRMVWGGSAGFGMAKDLAQIILGMDPMKNEAIWDKMQKRTFWGQGGS